MKYEDYLFLNEYQSQRKNRQYIFGKYILTIQWIIRYCRPDETTVITLCRNGLRKL